MEIAIGEKLKTDYPNLRVVLNDKAAIDSELDFYFPQLRFAIELNGIVHYEPIYGQDTFKRIRNNDSQKSIVCAAKGIELAVIDISGIKKVTPQSVEKCYSIVKDLVARIIGRAR